MLLQFSSMCAIMKFRTNVLILSKGVFIMSAKNPRNDRRTAYTDIEKARLLFQSLPDADRAEILRIMREKADADRAKRDRK